MSPFAKPSTPDDPDLGAFALRLWLVVLVSALTVAAWRLASLSVLLFASTLLAVGLDAVATRLGSILRMGRVLALATTVVWLAVLFGAALWFFGTVAADQLDEVVRQVPTGLRLLVAKLEGHHYGRFALEQAQDAGAAGAAGWAASALEHDLIEAIRAFRRRGAV